MEAIEHCDGYAVIDALQAWSCDPPDSWYADNLRTESIAIHAWETSVLREVRSTQVPGVAALQFFPMLIADPLQTNPQEINRSPLRPDPRPMFQILHGTFVLARYCRVHARLAEKFPHLRLEPALEKFREQFRNGFAALNQYMQPTPMGNTLQASINASLN